MNIGYKINKLFERSGYKNFADWGKAMGIPGDWLLDLKKRDTVKIIDITRLIVIAEYNNITLDDLLKDDNGIYVINVNDSLDSNDICKMLEQIQDQLKKSEVKFNGFAMSEECKELTFDAIDVLKGLVKSNL
jgi:hypothetical protein